MKDLRIAAIQMNAPCAKIAENLDRHEALARKAARRGARLICFPELSISGHFVHEDVWRHAEAVPDGPSYRRVQAIAQELRVVISAGIAERRDNLCYNTQFLAGPDGFIGKTTKVHLSRDEYFYFRAGAQFPVFDIGPCRVGIQICYDIVFPETTRILALNGAEVVLAPHASRCGQTKPDGESKRVREQRTFFEKIGWARARDNGVFMVMNNQAGDAGEHLGLDAVHGGGIVVTAPDGEPVAHGRARTFREEVAVVTLEAARFDAAHARACHNLQTRRPEIYGRLVEPG